YYKKIFVNKNGEETDSRDESFNEREEKYILLYPLEVVNYFVRENLDVSNIFSEKTAEKTIKFIYPKNNLKIIVPKDFDGEKSLIVKIANIKNRELYWYVNKEYAGKSREKERSFNLKKGNYEITVVSEKGETAKINFQVAEK
ncbi:MAG: penicillin-binding protein 1C, partial [Fusobacterium sp.]